jgi:uncharacterized protein YbgA (DUF1722 family)/uncharacterized protein YbbK (DUF523 family)
MQEERTGARRNPGAQGGIVEDVRPILVVSKCLGFASCRYNGAVIPDPFVARLATMCNVHTVCPEVEIGLGIPRDPVRVIEAGGELRLYQPATEADVTDAMRSFADAYLGAAGPVDGFVLKHRSPSCGTSSVKIYQGRDSDAPTTRGAGLFGAAVMERFPNTAVEDEGRLKNFTIREHFLTRLYATARFRRVTEQREPKALVGFHAAHKLLFMGYHQELVRDLGRIVANHEHRSPDELYSLYRATLADVLAEPPHYTSMINALYHAYGGVSKKLSVSEKRLFENTVEEYRDERIPLSVLLRLIESWAVRFENDYLLSQVLLHPYPQELVEITDSGKGRSR